MDAQIGKVLTKLEETGLDKNTIIVFTSDHGYHLGEKGHWQKQTLFESATKVPLIISGPVIENSVEKVDEPVELVDLYPTIMDLLEIKPPKFLQGKSLKPFLKDDSDFTRDCAFTELQLNKKNGVAQGYSIKTKRFRLTQWEFNGETSYELYDHKFDSAELNNISNQTHYAKAKDSLIDLLNKRIIIAQRVPDGLGRQISNVKPYNEPRRIILKNKKL